MAKNKKVVVTGGAGFIGSHLAYELVRRGYHVTILDDLSTGNRENIAALINPTNSTNRLLPQQARVKTRASPTKQGSADFVQGSVTNLPLLQEAFREVDFVFHQAAIPSVPRSIKDPRSSHEANITGTLNVLLAARDNNVRKVVYASSSSVYGDTPTLPKKEDMPPDPQSPYAVTKLAGEYYCQAFREIYGLPTVCLRYFNVYGPRQDPNSQYAAVVPMFINRVSRKKAPIIFGDGEQTRDFTFVKDAVEANILAAESDVVGVFNIGKGGRTTVNRLAEIIIQSVGSNVAPIYGEPRPGDVKHSLADISRAEAFGYNPKYSLKEGLKQTVSSFVSFPYIAAQATQQKGL